LRIFQPQSFISVDYGSKAITVVKRPLASAPGTPAPEETLHFSFAGQDALETQLKSFVLNVKERTIPKVDGREGRKVLAIALRIIDQIKGHQAKYPGLWQDEVQ
jgi:predicted dehydrogenase